MEEYPEQNTKVEADCGCGSCCSEHEEDSSDDEEWTTEDTAYEAHNMIDGLIEVLEKKGIITRNEVETMIDQMLDNNECEDESDDSDEEESSENNSEEPKEESN
ncbi:MAG: hypothetical protein U9R08_06795 [Nanoarchaeota archaeon]|nr:hypothetical protein [Nanoarchaeota archaeon]